MIPVFLAVLALLAPPDFSGVWKQDNARCTPKRSGDVTLTIRAHDSELVVETITRGLLAKHATQKYTTDGVESKSVGADGDQFLSKVLWKDGSLWFDIVEIEDGKRLKSSEVWSLIDDGRSLKRLRTTEKSGEQTLIYSRVN